MPSRKYARRVRTRREPSDPARLNLIAAMQARQASTAHLSREVLGKQVSYVYQYLYHQSPRELPADLRAKLAQVLDIPEAALRSQPVALPAAGTNGTIPLRQPSPRGMIDVLPARIVGAEAPAWTRQIGVSLELVPALAQFETAPTTFAVRVTADALEPFYSAGDLVYLQPNRAMTSTEGVTVQLRDGTTWFGLLNRLTAQSIELANGTGKTKVSFNVAECRLIARDVARLRLG